MGCKNSKVIPREKQEQVIKEAKRRQNSALGNTSPDNGSSKENKKKPRSPSIPKPTPSKPMSKEMFQEMVSDKTINNAKKTTGGVAFDIGTTDLPKKAPKMLTKKKQEPTEDLAITYSSEEKALMAEILKDDEVRGKSLKADLHRDKVKRRKMFLEAEKAYNAQMALDNNNNTQQ